MKELENVVIGVAIRLLRLRAEMLISELAEKSELKEKTILRIENGEGKFSSKKMTKILTALNKKQEDLDLECKRLKDKKKRRS